jgi:hypothetical protein
MKPFVTREEADRSIRGARIGKIASIVALPGGFILASASLILLKRCYR